MSETRQAQSNTIDLGGRTHYLDYGGPADGPLVVAVHGLGGAAWNWSAVAPLLTPTCRLLAIDLAGHGLSPAGSRSTSVRDNRRLLDRFLTEVAGEPVVLMGNSMGGLITLLEAAASPDRVRGAILVDPALPRPTLARIDPRVALMFAAVMAPRLGEAALARRRNGRSLEQQMNETLALCCVDRRQIPASVLAEGMAVMTQARDSGEFEGSDFLIAARSLVRLLARPRRVRARMRMIAAPVLLLHGEQDRLVSIRVAHAAARAFPAWRFEVAPNVGHVPMLEAPEWTAGQVLDWLAQIGLVPQGSAQIA